MTLAARSITVGYVPKQPVLRDLSMNAAPGAITAVVGPNASGKTTLLRALLGLLRLRSGKVLLDNKAVHALPARARATRLAYVPQRSSLSAAFSVERVIALGRHALPPSQAAIDAAIEDARLTERRRALYAELSVGQQQRVAIARALAQLDHRTDFTTGATPPPYLLADEPLSAMDPDHALQTAALLTAVARRGAGVLVVLHDLTMARRIAGSALVLDRAGCVVADGPVREALSPSVLERVFDARFQEVETAGGPVLLAESPRETSASATIPKV